MKRQYTRIDIVRNILDSDIKGITDEEVKRCAYVHLYGVGQAAAFIAMKRGYDRATAELAEVAGMLHDYTKFIYDKEEKHAEESAIIAKKILSDISDFSKDEIELIYIAIRCHSCKNEKGSYFDEIIKDADEMQHFFRNPREEYYFQKDRTQKLMNELGIKL